jgi:hypothetical protein
MAYQLSTADLQTDARGAPVECATDNFFAYPQPAAVKGNDGGSRPNTELYGTAPYYAGKGAPSELVDVQDRLRPQSTTRFGRVLVSESDRLHPLQDMSCAGPVQVRTTYPSSTRSDIQNASFSQRYCNRQ